MTAPATALRRVLTPRLLYILVIGDILGAGIYILVGGVAGEAGGLTWLAFALAFVIVSASAASYSELATSFPDASGWLYCARRESGSGERT